MSKQKVRFVSDIDTMPRATLALVVLAAAGSSSASAKLAAVGVSIEPVDGTDEFVLTTPSGIEQLHISA